MRAVDALTASSAAYIDNVESDGVFVELPIDKSGEMDVGMEHGHHLEHHVQQEDVRAANKINDELRFSIIDAIYLRPAIWDHGRELKSLGQRKDHFIEIAALLSTDANMLSYRDIEKQWKNLKDTYFKLRKKVRVDEAGNLVQPRWKYFSAMMFLDRLHSGNGASSSACASMLDGIDDRAIVDHGSGLGKRNVDGNLTAVARSGRFSDRQQRPTTPVSSIVDAQPSVSAFLAPEDEYSAFCNSLIYPLREIGSTSRLEYVKLQKLIRDAIFDKQMELLTSGSATSNRIL